MYSRWRYYLSSLPTLALGIENWGTMVFAFAGLPIRVPFLIYLRNGLEFEARTGLDIWIIKESCLDRDYERQSVPIQDGWTIIDIGAGLGDFAIQAARRIPNGVVYAYEPAPDSYSLLIRNINRNNVKNVKAFNYAINGEGKPMVVDVGRGEPVLYRTSVSDEELKDSLIEVDAITLDQVLSDNNINRCDFLKIDCEGGEYDLLFHASDAALQKLQHICLEYHEGVTQFTHKDLMNFFEQKGFVVKHAPNPVHQETGFLYAHRG